MALPNNQLEAITVKLIESKLVNNVYNSNGFLVRLNRPGHKKMRDGGTKITVPIISSKPSGTGGSYSGSDTLVITGTDDMTAAEYEWRQYYQSVFIARDEILKNKSSKYATLNLIVQKIEIAKRQMKENLVTGLFSDGTGNGGKDIDGLGIAVAAAGTYGAIAPADLAEWVAPVDANGAVARALTLDLMQSVYGSATEDGEAPSAIFCKQSIYDKVWGLYQPFQRLVSKEMADLGFKNVLTFNGVPIIVDSHAIAGGAGESMYFVNEDHTYLVVHKDEDMRQEKNSSLETQNAHLTKIFFMGNMVTDARRLNARLDDLIA